MSRAEIERPPGGVSTREEPGRIRVAIADDHPAYRDQLAVFLRARGLDVVGEVGNGRAAIELVESARPDLIVMDLRMPLLSGFEAIRRLARLTSRRRILAISAAATEDEITDAILSGADGHISKDRAPQELIWVLMATVAGQPLLAPGTAQVLLRRLRGQAEPGRSLVDTVMFQREWGLLACLAQSYTTAQTAMALNATPDEINQDIELLLTKLRAEQWIHDADRTSPVEDDMDE